MESSESPWPLDPLEALRARAQAVLRQISEPDPGWAAQPAAPSPPADRMPPRAPVAVRASEPDPPPAGLEEAECYRLLFEVLPIAALVINAQGQVLKSNPEGQVRLGLERVPDPCGLLDALEAPVRSELQLLLRQPASHHLIKGARLSDALGRTRRVDLKLVPLPLPSGDDAGPRFLLLLTDRSEEYSALIDRQLLRSLLDSSEAFIYAHDTEGRLLVANQTLLRQIGKPLEEVVGRQREQFFPLRDCVDFAGHDQSVVRSGQTLRVQERLHGPAGVRTFDSHKFPLRDESDQIIGVGGISLDVTAQIDTQHWLRISEEVFLHAREAIVVTDANGWIVRVNPAFTTISGFSAEAVIGHRISLLHSGEYDEAFYQRMWDQILETDHWQGELVNRAANGQLFVVWASISTLRDDQGQRIGYMAIEADLTELRQVHEELATQARTDSLTGLPNRALFAERLSHHIALAKRQQQPFALLFADLDHFKEVNDSLGHDVGDELLVTLARRLRDSVREQDTVARLGGDEFVALFPCTDRAQAGILAERLLRHLREPLTLDRLADYQPHASVGLAMYPDDGDSPEALMRSADQAMYAAKRGGRNQLHTYTAILGEQNRENFSLRQELRVAPEQGQLRVYWQPKFELDTMRVVGAEALVRWEHPRLGLLTPALFLPTAEQHQMVSLIDQWVLQHTLQQLAQWQRSGRWPQDWRLAVNQTADDLVRPQWLDRLGALLESEELAPCWLEVELSETVWAHSSPDMLERLCQLRDLGVTLSIDDFGTGYSNLAYLKTLPASTLKIDQSFVRDMLSDDNDLVLVQAMIDLAGKLGFGVVAEGVETEQQRDRLCQIGCSLGQGYLLSRPLSSAEFEARFLPLVMA